MSLTSESKIGIAGAGAMGAGIAQVAANAGHRVVLFDLRDSALDSASSNYKKVLTRQVEKGNLTEEQARESARRIRYTTDIGELAGSNLVIEAIVEDLRIKKELFEAIDALAKDDVVLATNTSSLSVTAIAATITKPEKFVGLHFFNPAPLMPLVEIIPAIQTDPSVIKDCTTLITSWGKIPVIAKDTPGFIVNRIARPFYGEAIRILEEGFADIATIDHAMKSHGGFRMGPFELMDFIGNDINYTVTETVFREFWSDPRYKPSFTQKRLVEAGRLGKKSGRGYYDYSDGAVMPQPTVDENLSKNIFQRVLVMLINEAADALYLNIATRDDIELAMTKGVNYPKGLLKWADEMGIAHCVETLDRLYAEYHEDRYRASALLRRMVRNNETFF